MSYSMNIKVHVSRFEALPSQRSPRQYKIGFVITHTLLHIFYPPELLSSKYFETCIPIAYIRNKMTNRDIVRLAWETIKTDVVLSWYQKNKHDLAYTPLDIPPQNFDRLTGLAENVHLLLYSDIYLMPADREGTVEREVHRIVFV